MDDVISAEATLASLVDSSSTEREQNLLTELGETVQSFQSRLQSYRMNWWASKPVHISPWLCARYGWYCIEKDLLQCVECKQYVSAHLPSLTDSILLMKSVNRFRSCLTESHSRLCFFHDNIVDESLCVPNVTDLQVAKEQFSSRLHQLLELCSSHTFSRYKFEDVQVNDDEQPKLLDFCKLCVSDDLANRVTVEACWLALTGWQIYREVPDSIFCEYCQRRVGMWLFLDQTSSEFSVSDTDKNKQRRFSAVDQHQKWCPWVTQVSSYSVLYAPLDTKNAADIDLHDYTATRWMALYRLLIPRHQIIGEELSDSRSDINSDDYIFAKQLLGETLSQEEIATTTTAMNNVCSMDAELQTFS